MLQQGQPGGTTRSIAIAGALTSGRLHGIVVHEQAFAFIALMVTYFGILVVIRAW